MFFFLNYIHCLGCSTLAVDAPGDLQAVPVPSMPTSVSCDLTFSLVLNVQALQIPESRQTMLCETPVFQNLFSDSPSAVVWILLIHTVFLGVARQSRVISHPYFIADDVTPGADRHVPFTLALLHVSHPNMFTST